MRLPAVGPRARWRGSSGSGATWDGGWVFARALGSMEACVISVDFKAGRAPIRAMRPMVTEPMANPFAPENSLSALRAEARRQSLLASQKR